MRRFIFICVALIAFAATNASGTDYQTTDQLQTHCIVQADLPTISPATVVVNNFQPVTYSYTLMPVEKQKSMVSGFSAVFRYPDYGLNSNNECVVSRYSSINKHTFKSQINNKLPASVQRE